MNGPNSTLPERRYGEHPVTLIGPDGSTLKGTSYALYPVDEPPVIEVASVDRRWYQEVWESRGWEVVS